ncbi:periplasmic binding protein-like I [Cunninghamella echinulata]|nr:periplasmic binding protein-like I [Cunninghamella echinulata]
MVDDGINAVIGDMISNLTELSAGVTSLFYIPQCSGASSSLQLSDKINYPYFFRTVGNVVAFGEALMEWIRQMNWSMFALVYTDDNVGQQILTAMVTKSMQYNITAMTQIPLYDLEEAAIQESLKSLGETGARIIIVADSNPDNQIKILKMAKTMGMLTKGWVWMLTNDLSEALSESVDPEDLEAYNGLMFISGLWNLTDVPAYNDLYNLWTQQKVPAGFANPNEWKTAGLSYNAPNAYACAELLALGLNKALNQYPGGRQKGLQDLSTKNFNSKPMTPLFYNMNYTGPAGLMSFQKTGDQVTGHFELLYMTNGSTAAYARVNDGVYKPIPGVPILYLGDTLQWPTDMATKSILNPKTSEPAGLAIYVIACLGILICIISFVLIICYRNLQVVLVSSPIFLCLQIIGICLCYTSVILYVNGVTPAKCIVRQLCLVIGFVLMVGSIIAKNYRVYRVFQNVFTLQASKLKSIYLLRFVGLFGTVALLPLIVWYALYPVVVKIEMVTMNSSCMMCEYPTSNKQYDWLHLNLAELICLILCYLLICVAALLAWKTRKISNKWSESQQIGYVSYNAVLAAIVAAPAFFLPKEQFVIAIYLKLAAILFSASFTLLVLFLPKLILIFKHMSSQCWFSIWNRYPGQHPHHPMDDRFASCSELTSEYRFKTPDNSNAQDALIAKNLLDYTVTAHEGVLPVKKRARFHFMSIWQLKQVIVIPSKQTFVLVPTNSNSNGSEAEYHQYSVCQPMLTTRGRYIFCVWTDKNVQFYFQVYDHNSLTRWVNWFTGKEINNNNNNNNNNNTGEDQIVQHHLIQRKNPNLPSTSTLAGGGADSSNNNGDNITSEFSSFNHNNPRSHQLMMSPNHHLITGYTQGSSMHRSSQYNMYTSSIGTPISSFDATNAATVNFYNPQFLYYQQQGSSNGTSTFGVGNDQQQSSSGSRSY